MNIFQELYEDLKNINVKVPRTRKKHMDDQITPEQPQAPVETTEPIVEPVASEETPVVQTETEDRSVFNCPDCEGEGLKDQFSLCSRCKGTGKL